MLKKNLLANYLGYGWSALMAFLFVPIYIKFLGIEAYGLIGFFALLQSILAILDMGLSTTISREMATFKGGGHSNLTIRDLLRSVEVFTVAIAFLIMIVGYLSSDWIANAWINSNSISSKDVADAVALMGDVISTRLIENIYRSGMIGLQQQVWLNMIVSSLATVRGIGAVLVLAFISPTIFAFFFWQAIISIIIVVALSMATYKFLPSFGYAGQFSWQAIKKIKNFAGGVVGLSILSLLQTQLDKLLLSKLLPLSEYGYYMLASVLALSLYSFVLPITQALTPRITQLYISGKKSELIDKFHEGAQLVSIIAGSGCLVMIFQGEVLLRLWTQDLELAEKVSPILCLLSLGFLFNMAMWIPFETQLAHGFVKLSIKINIYSVFFAVPLIIILTNNLGATGAAWAWVIMNLAKLLIAAPLMFRKILPDEKWRWYWYDILIPLISAGILVFLYQLVAPPPENIFEQIATLGITSILALLASSLTSGYIRKVITKRFCKF